MVSEEYMGFAPITRFQKLLALDDEVPPNDGTDEVVESASDEPLYIFPPAWSDEGDDEAGDDASEGADGEPDDIGDHA